MSNRLLSLIHTDALGKGFILGGLSLASIGSQWFLSARTVGVLSGQGSDVSGLALHAAPAIEPLVDAGPSVNMLLIGLGMLFVLIGCALHMLSVLKRERPGSVRVRACRRCMAGGARTTKKAVAAKPKRTEIIWIERTFRM